jgi:SAM-dependent methyltransferase
MLVSQLQTTCLISGKPVEKILDFGQHPYADTFISQEQYCASEPVFPLQVYMNSESGGIQLGYISDAKSRYNLYSYSYTMSNSKTSRDHWDELAEYVKSKYGNEKLVVEVGSNDGYLIGQFAKGIGVDSSTEMCGLAMERGVDVINGLFDVMVADHIRQTQGPANVVLANNVFNHANNPVDFAIAVSKLLDDTGVFIFEVPYWGWMVTNGQFPDMVYHEHPSYVTVKSAQNLLARAGLTIADFELVNYHGQSLRITAKRGVAVEDKVTQAIKNETDQGLFDPKFYIDLQGRLEKVKVEWLAKFYKILDDDPDAVVIGVGAAAKANTWLHWHGLDSTVIKYITDASPYKQGKYTPLTRIPICGDEEFANHDCPYALVLSWNIGETLKQALLKINPKTRFISQ